MPIWSQGRVALVGDAAACVSLLAGEGTGLAMTEAFVLAGERNQAHGDYRAALQRYEQRLRPLIADKQAGEALARAQLRGRRCLAGLSLEGHGERPPGARLSRPDRPPGCRHPSFHEDRSAADHLAAGK